MFCQYIFTTTTLQTTFSKLFFAFVFCFVKHKSVEIFNAQIMWLAFINYKQQIHWIFKYLIINVDWKGQFIFIAKSINANVVFHFSFTKRFFPHGKSNSVIIKIINQLFIFLGNSLWCIFMELICLTWLQIKHFDCCFLCWLVLFLTF